MQTQVFQERCGKAEALSARLETACDQEYNLADGDAHQVREALKLSLAYFSGPR